MGVVEETAKFLSQWASYGVVAVPVCNGDTRPIAKIAIKTEQQERRIVSVHKSSTHTNYINHVFPFMDRTPLVPPAPTATWNLLKIKQGTLLTTHPLTSLSSHRQGCITFGHIDDPTHIDIVTAHESCSRLHSRLARFQRYPMATRFGIESWDVCQSCEIAPPQACGKREVERGTREDGMRGSRGVMVYVGDVFWFGTSTRIFCLEGSEEYDWGEEGGGRCKRKCEGESPVAEVERDCSQVLEQQQKQTVEECNWGMGEDDSEQNK
eukprot:CCRYP_011447-RA/>CCRYP_011447-RA protein AED:0.41 eAED:0.20 QI:0/-1/0/1/-1/1/1/0/265